MRRLLLAFSLIASGTQAEEVLEYDGYHSVEVRNGIVANVTVSDAVMATVDDANGDIAQLVTAQFGEWLRLDRNKRWLLWTNGRRDQFTATLEMLEVRELKALSGAKITGELGNQLRFRAEAENGVIEVTVNTPNLRIRGNDNAEISVSGTCGRLTMLARPTSSVDLAEMTCDSVVIFGDKSRVILPEGANVVDEHPAADS